MTYVIDRFEGEFAAVENQDTRAMENIHISALPPGAKEGSYLTRDADTFTIIAPPGDDDMDDLMKLFEE